MSENYTQPLDEILDQLDVDQEKGLSQDEVQNRQDEYGPNQLDDQEQKPIWKMLLDHLNNIIVYLLGAAALLSIFMGDYIEAVAIVIAVLISVLTGFIAEYKAQQSAEALQNMVDTQAKVVRAGSEEEIPANELVPGDILLLSEGDAISADGRIIEANNFAVMEAALTGESEAVDKDPDVELDGDESIGDRLNMVFSGTAVTRGTATVVVTEIGMDTEVGNISSMLENDGDQETPLDKEINQLGKALIIVAIVAAALVFVIGLINGQELTEMLHIAIILAVAAIPEAMPAVETITLSNGMNTMADHNALVKRLSSVETLGSTSIIASDKTGTLTENQMMVQAILLADGNHYQVSGSGYLPEGEISQDDEPIDLAVDDLTNEPDSDLFRFIRDGFLSSQATLVHDEDLADESESDDEEAQRAKEYSIEGDPTDGALTVLGHKIGLNDEMVDDQYEEVAQLAFDSNRKYMAVLMKPVEGKPFIIIKGAPDVLFDMADLSSDELSEWEDNNSQLAKQGMRAIALGRIEISDDNVSDWTEDDLTEAIDQETIQLAGLYGIIDPPRSDVAESIKLTQDAGIKVMMITGDHPETAAYISGEIGIENADRVITGQEIDESVDKDDFADKVLEAGVFARVSPENKKQIIEALQAKDHVLAMTGDGVNDAPALSGADIGVAMGIRGTEVAKESADMILTDDRFSTIVDAVEVGRIIFENIKKYVSFLFTCNMVEIATILMTILLGLAMPLQPLHILFLNLVIDVGPAISLAYERAEDDVMKHPPRDKNSGLVTRPFLIQILISGIVLGLASFGLFYLHDTILGYELNYSQTATFAFMAVAQLMHLLNVRKSDTFGLDTSLFQNKVMIGAVLISIGLLLAAVYLPVANGILATTGLELISWLYIMVGGIIATAFVYLIKRLAGFKK